MCNFVFGIGLHPVILCEIVVKLWFASRPFRLVREIRVRKPVMNVTEARRLRIAMDDGYELACVQVKVICPMRSVTTCVVVVSVSWRAVPLQSRHATVRIPNFAAHGPHRLCPATARLRMPPTLLHDVVLPPGSKGLMV